MKNLMSGQEEIRCPQGRLSIRESSDSKGCRHSPHLELRGSGGEVIWEARLDGLEENSASSEQRSMASDFEALVFSEGRLLLIAGNNKAVSVDLDSGLVVEEASLLQTDSSLDLLELFETKAGQAIAVSARRIVCFSLAGMIADAVEVVGPVASVLGVEDGSISIRRYDFEDPSQTTVEEVLPLNLL